LLFAVHATAVEVHVLLVLLALQEEVAVAGVVLGKIQGVLAVQLVQLQDYLVLMTGPVQCTFLCV
jgi:hypothetical protein